jgi:hypothetical protein
MTVSPSPITKTSGNSPIRQLHLSDRQQRPPFSAAAIRCSTHGRGVAIFLGIAMIAPKGHGSPSPGRCPAGRTTGPSVRKSACQELLLHPDKLHDIWMADTREHANQAFDLFGKTYEAKYPKAVECLTKGCGSRVACLTMVYKLMQSASKRWRLLNGTQVLIEVLRGTIFIDGICIPQVAA